ncbi:DegT/DnrJ/EryC1/StrS family aminotransferase [Alkalicoccobacillus murimartini]|uniref:dTDP-4-amino-4,6-dideoxygalactose transaminase n=1 Tax=Alkalicoccobacillus murimartini TaxID=171685 RepID=A0ABT9YK50_9BACI|nr:dTDP-4-amino-4,6-dideoxygalactose transaminase [Alkalicoccobacillus murimartini]
MIPLINLDRQFQQIKAEAMEAFSRVYDSGQYILGAEGKQFEEEVKAYLNTPYAIGVGNGTDALVLALDALGIGEGDEVITTPFTFFATAEAISRVGATPVFVDIESKTFNIDTTQINDVINEKTKAIMPVHLFGQPADMKAIMTIAKANNLYVIEDACQAFGATVNGKKAGTIGDIGCFSFFPTKNLGTMGDGGMIVTKHNHVSEKIRLLRHHGSTKKYYHEEIGYNSRLDEVQAALLRISLTHIDEWNSNRQSAAAFYNQEFMTLQGVTVPHIQSDSEHIYHLYCLDLENRDGISTGLSKAKIANGVYYPRPLHLQEVYKGLSYNVGDFPIAEKKSKSLLAIPMHPYLSKDEQVEIIRTISSVVSGSKP